MMIDGVLFVFILLATAFGGAALALSQRQHWEAVVGRNGPSRQMKRLRRTGWGLIGVSAALSVIRDGIAFGVLLWPMAVFAGALTIVFILAYRPNTLRPLATFFTAPEEVA